MYVIDGWKGHSRWNMSDMLKQIINMWRIMIKISNHHTSRI